MIRKQKERDRQQQSSKKRCTSSNPGTPDHHLFRGIAVGIFWYWYWFSGIFLLSLLFLLWVLFVTLSGALFSFRVILAPRGLPTKFDCGCCVGQVSIMV